MDWERAQKLVAVMASDKEGEVIAAVGALQRALKSAGLTWHDLAQRVGEGAPSRPSDQSARLLRENRELQNKVFVLCHRIKELEKALALKPSASRPYEAIIEDCLASSTLSAWESEFLENIQYVRHLSPKQRRSLRRIAKRLGVCGMPEAEEDEVELGI